MTKLLEMYSSLKEDILNPEQKIKFLPDNITTTWKELKSHNSDDVKNNPKQWKKIENDLLKTGKSMIGGGAIPETEIQLVEAVSKPYPLVTIQMDKMGSLHVWKGKVKSDKYYKANGKEADLYFQGDAAIHVLDYLPKKEKDEIEKGWSTTTHFFPDEFMNESLNEATISEKENYKLNITKYKDSSYNYHYEFSINNKMIEKRTVKSRDKQEAITKLLENISKLFK